jgi:chromosomal replication initiator protein
MLGTLAKGAVLVVLIRDIQRATAEHYGVSFETMYAPEGRGVRGRQFAWPRQMAMLLSRRMTPHSKVRIGQFFGGRDHSTIIHGCRQARRRCLADPKQLKMLCEIRAKVLNEYRTYVHLSFFDPSQGIS